MLILRAATNICFDYCLINLPNTLSINQLIEELWRPNTDFNTEKKTFFKHYKVEQRVSYIKNVNIILSSNIKIFYFKLKEILVEKR